MSGAFWEQLNRFIMVFVDDILIYSRCEVEHEIHLREVMDVLRRNRLKAKFSKCCFQLKEVCFLGHVVSLDELAVDQKNVATVRDQNAEECDPSGLFSLCLPYYRPSTSLTIVLFKEFNSVASISPSNIVPYDI